MCYSLRSSILSLIIGMISAFSAIYLGQIALGTFIFCYSFMQISEAFIWYGIDHNDLNMNRWGTLIGKYTLPAHVMGFGIGILASIYWMQQRTPTYTEFIPLIIGILFYLYVLYFQYSKDLPDVTYPRDVSCMADRRCQNGNNRLEWKYSNTDKWGHYYISILVLIALFYIKPMSSKIAIPSMYMLTLLGIYYYMEGSQALGSVWCVSTALLAPIIVLINYYLTRHLDATKMLT